MGNCCGSQSSDYDEATPASTRPQKARVRASGPGHTLGGPPTESSTGPDPRNAAALAAEANSLPCLDG